MKKWMLLGILASGLTIVGTSNVARADYRPRGCVYGYGSGSSYGSYGDYRYRRGYSSPYRYDYSSYSPYRYGYRGYSSYSPYRSSFSISFGNRHHSRHGHRHHRDHD